MKDSPAPSSVPAKSLSASPPASGSSPQRDTYLLPTAFRQELYPLKYILRGHESPDALLKDRPRSEGRSCLPRCPTRLLCVRSRGFTQEARRGCEVELDEVDEDPTLVQAPRSPRSSDIASAPVQWLCESQKVTSDLINNRSISDQCSEENPAPVAPAPPKTASHQIVSVLCSNRERSHKKQKCIRSLKTHHMTLSNLTMTLLPAVCLCAQGKYAFKLLNDLFKNYTNALRPVEDTDNIINVTLQITLSQIIDMDERNQILTTYLWIRQVWFDAYLTWNKTDYDGLDTIRIPSSYVWRPDIVLYNNADEQFSSSMETNVVIHHDGQILWDQPAITKSSCKVDVSFFPFDAQQCRFTFGSWTHNGNQMDLHNSLDSADLADFVENVEWEVLGMPAKKNVILYGCCSDPYPDITYTLHLKRRATFYIFNLLIPCMMISFLAPLGFYLPADSGEKVSLGVTVLLALTVFQLLVAESMPPSENVPLIGKYYIATMTMITASTALTIFIINIHHCGPEAQPVPAWARRFILHYLARICFVYDMGEDCLSTHPDKPAQKGNNCTINSQARGEDFALRVQSVSASDVCPHKTKDKLNEDVSPTLSLGPGKECPSGWTEGTTVGMDHGETAGAKDGCGGRFREGGVGGKKSVKKREILLEGQCICHHQTLLRNIEYIANCYYDQKATQRRSGEWRKVAKIMDRFFMWIFFIMVFLMSLLIIGKAV
ncbi:neuronal acetylcholine receptor subunit alpha-9-like [Myxocyprinus asiaticus]|uniref:neuronal acetylcholine receptor subunit alpha-9-like n=1 Tax=Myxocyprinus asiaticus TaxID=70543 RepID=UPI00222320ED|nr:neuronal acetylcholine receptor subunit alpha-9-like [Myxocyprinus asiaticus]